MYSYVKFSISTTHKTHYSVLHSPAQHSYVHYFNKYLLSTHYISSSVLYVNITNVELVNPEASQDPEVPSESLIKCSVVVKHVGSRDQIDWFKFHL